MTSEDRTEAATTTGATDKDAQAEEQTMARYGIIRVPVDYFHYGNFRYTNLDDAVAEARRNKAAGSDPRIEASESDEMMMYGITRVPVDYFHYGNFRYTNLDDAVAEAKRQKHAA